MAYDSRSSHTSSRSTQPPSRPAQTFTHLQFKPLKATLFNEMAQQSAQAVALSDNNRNKSTQLRRFYDELCLWHDKVLQQADLQKQAEKFEECLPFIRMINAKAAYAEGRKLVDPTFVNLLSHTLSEVNSVETLKICKLFWEAFMGFYKQERPN